MAWSIRMRFASSVDDTPIAFPYFYYHMSATKPTVLGIEATAMGHINLAKAGFKSS